MIPVSMLSSDPAMGKLAAELAGKRICRFCLSDGENLVDLGAEKPDLKDCWKAKLATCLSISPVNSENLPKFICELCSKFVDKCYEFRQLCKKTELLLMSYPLTGTWPERLELPSFLRAAKKRLLKTTDAESTPIKQSREGEPSPSHPIPGCIVANPECRIPHNPSFHCDLQSNYGTIRIEANLTPTQVGSIRVRSRESLTTHATLQSPTITSEVGQQRSSPVIYDLKTKQTVDDTNVVSQPVSRSNHVPKNGGSTVIGQTTIKRSSPMISYPQQADQAMIPPQPTPQQVDNSYGVSQSTLPCLRQMINSIGTLPPTPKRVQQSQPMKSIQSLQRVDNSYAVNQPTMQPQQTPNQMDKLYAARPYAQQYATPTNSNQFNQPTYSVTQPVLQYSQPTINSNATVQAPVQQQQFNMYAVTQQVKPYPFVVVQSQQPSYSVLPYPHQHLNSTAVSQASPLQNQTLQPVNNSYAVAQPNTFINQPPLQHPSPLQTHDPSAGRLSYNQFPASYQQPTLAITSEVSNAHQSPQQQQQQPGTPVFRCNSCSFRFVVPNHLTLHERKHTGRTHFTCGCGEKFHRLSSFVAHLQQRHLTQQQNLSWCFLCRKVFGPDCQPWQHLNQHAAAKLTQACDFCSLIFVNQAERIAHVGKVHESEVRQVMTLNGIERY